MTRARMKIEILIRNKPTLVARRRKFIPPKRRARARGRVAVSINSGCSGMFVSSVPMIAPHRHGLRLAAAGTRFAELADQNPPFASVGVDAIITGKYHSRGLFMVSFASMPENKTLKILIVA